MSKVSKVSPEEEYVLQLDRCVYQRLAKEDVCSIDQIEARRVCLSMEQKALFLLKKLALDLPCHTSSNTYVGVVHLHISESA